LAVLIRWMFLGKSQIARRIRACLNVAAGAILLGR